MSDTNVGFVGYEYMEASVKKGMEPMYADSYQCFGWLVEGSVTPEGRPDQVNLKLKRNRKLRNVAELTRLQRQFENCAHEVEALENSKTRTASVLAFSVGLIATVFLGLAAFAYLRGSYLLMAAAAVPGFLGWVLPWFCYQKVKRDKTVQLAPMIEQKRDEIYSVCEQASMLLTS